MKLPELVDGRNVFKGEGEVIGRAHLVNDSNKHFYHNQTRDKKNCVFCWTMGKNGPGDRDLHWIPENQLVFY